MNSLEEYQEPASEIEYIYSFCNSEIVKLMAYDLKGVILVNRITGDVITGYGFLPWHKYGNCRWFDSEENLLKYGINFEI